MKKIIKLSIEENQLKIERFVDIMVLDPHNNNVGMKLDLEDMDLVLFY